MEKRDDAYAALRALVGEEHTLRDVGRTLRHTVEQLNAPVVGALEVNCSDESELECMDAFQHEFVAPLLPDLKRSARAPFRTCNLGARYEWGSVRVAEHHYALPASRHAFKVLLLKLNGHVAVTDTPEGTRFGPMARYQTESAACGALHALLRGDELPALLELRDTFQCADKDRLDMLRDPAQVPEAYRYLYAAVAGVQLQALRALADIHEHAPHSPTLYLVVACITLNRPGPDTEILCGFHEVRPHEAGRQQGESYWGLGDDPSLYRVQVDGDQLRMTTTQ